MPDTCKATYLHLVAGICLDERCLPTWHKAHHTQGLGLRLGLHRTYTIILGMVGPEQGIQQNLILVFLQVLYYFARQITYSVGPFGSVLHR